MRIVYVSCFLDTWANPIVYDLAKAAEGLGAELFFIAEKEKISDARINYIDIGKGAVKFKFPDLFERNCFKWAGVKNMQELERQWQSVEQPNVKFEEGFIDELVHMWFWEAVMVLKIVQPDFGIVFNGQIGRRGAYAEAFKSLGIPFVYAEKGMLPESWYMDEQGINAEASWVDQMPKIQSDDTQIGQFLKKLNEIDKKGKSAWEQPQRKNLSQLRSELNIRDDQKIIFFPGQVDSDTNIIKYSPYFKNSSEALTWLRDGLKDGKYFILAKPHPKGLLTADDYRNILNAQGAVVDLNVLDAIELADCIVTINSTVAFEAAIRQKPVLLLGQGVLSRQEFVMKYRVGASSGNQLNELLRAYESNEASNKKKALSFGVWLDEQIYCYRGNPGRVQEILGKYTARLPKSTVKTFSAAEILSLLSLPEPKNFVELINKKVFIELLGMKLSGMFKRISLRH